MNEKDVQIAAALLVTSPEDVIKALSNSQNVANVLGLDMAKTAARVEELSTQFPCWTPEYRAGMIFGLIGALKMVARDASITDAVTEIADVMYTNGENLLTGAVDAPR